MEIPRVVFFGRTGEEACRFFNLDLARWRGSSLLDCPGGPGSLTALARRAGVEVVAVDPLYALPPEQQERRCRDDIRLTIERLRRSPTLRPDFDLAAFERDKLTSLELFLEDLRAHPASYVPAALPTLPFEDARFDLVLCGHLLFAYAPLADGGIYEHDGFDLRWHQHALAELRRVCKGELRLFPAYTLARPTHIHPYVEPLLSALPLPWQGSLESTTYDQGAEGETLMLRLHRMVPSTGSTGFIG